jgi:hypothetical protein
MVPWAAATSISVTADPDPGVCGSVMGPLSDIVILIIGEYYSLQQTVILSKTSSMTSGKGCARRD